MRSIRLATVIWLLTTPPAAAESKGTFSLDTVPCLGFENCQRISNGQVEIVVTTDVGPRIARYAMVGGPNALAEMRKKGDPPPEMDRFNLFGGHRLWVGPEDRSRTYQPDNLPVLWSRLAPNRLQFTAPVDARTGLQKTITVSLETSGSRATIGHRIENRGKKATALTPWAITVLPSEGTGLIPNEPEVAHDGAGLLPVRNIALWGYADMGDGRVRWGKRFLHLSPLDKKTPFKIGIENRQGWMAHVQATQVFVKRFPFQEGRVYPDRNSNCELFTNGAFMELESLGPIQKVAPGKSATHEEVWQLFANVKIPTDDDAIDTMLRPLLRGE